MKRLLVLALSLAMTVTAAGCTDATGPQGALSGTYTLRSVNGSTLAPWTIVNTPQYTSEVLSSAVMLDANGNYSSVTHYRDTYSGQAPTLVDDTITGYWTLSGSQLTLTDTTVPSQPFTYYATISGSTITFNDNVGVSVYSK
jgi:hypothetical protein